MRSLFKLSLAALIALAFAGTAMAVDVKFSGNIGTAFGLANLGETGPADNQAAISAYATSYEANVRTTIGGGPLTQVVRFRPRGSNINGATGDWNVADVYAETNWRPIDNLLIQMGRMQGGAWSNPLAGAYLIHNAIGVTHQEYWLNWTGADGLDIEFNLGAMQIGVALASECRPFCGSTTSGAQAASIRSPQSMHPHFNGKFGDITVRAQLPTTSGKDSVDEARGGSGLQAGVAWSGGGGLMVAADLQNFTDKASGGADTEDYTKSATVIRVDVAGITIALFSATNTNMGGTKDNNNTVSTLNVRYALKVGDGTIIPEYSSITTTPEEGDAVTNTLIRLIGNMTY
jgi:hypothetical protein